MTQRLDGCVAIVNVSSVNGFVGAWGIAAYASSKFALRGLTRVAAIGLARKGVRVNSIHPGPIDTPMLRGGLRSLAAGDLAMYAGVPFYRAMWEEAGLAVAKGWSDDMIDASIVFGDE